MATLSAQSLSSLELGPKCANLHLVLISFWALTTGSIFSNQTLEIQQRLQILGFGGLLALKGAANSRIWGPPCTESAANSRIWGPPCTGAAQDLGDSLH